MNFEEIRLALNSGKFVHWKNSEYTVIKHSSESCVNFYIVWDLFGPKQNHVHLTESDFEKEYQESDFYIEKKIQRISIGFSELGKKVRIVSEDPKDVIEHLNSLDRRYKNELGYFKTDLTIHFSDSSEFKFRYDIGDGISLESYFDKYIPHLEI